MLENITVWSKNTIEYKKLKVFKSLLDVIIEQNNLPISVSIQDTYFDFGQGWMWTTIIVTELNNNSCLNSYQLLYPARHERIVFGDEDDILEVCHNVKKELLERYKEEN